MRQSNVAKDLDLNLGYRIGEVSFRELVRRIKQVQPEVIVEFGAGASSIRLSQAFKLSAVFSIDHDAEYFHEAEQLKNTYDVKNLHLLYRPLKWQMYGLALYQSYAKGAFPSKVDVVIIDGPPHYSFDGREGCLYQIYRHLRVGGVVILDDYDRVPEQSFVRHWMARYPGSFECSPVGGIQSLCSLTKIQDSKAHMNGRQLITSYRRLFRKCFDGKFMMRFRTLYVRGKKWLKRQ